MGRVYVALNASMPNLVKVGYTDGSVEQRLNQLAQHTGVPQEFTCAYECEVTSAHRLEQAVHAALAHVRLKRQREFFETSVPDAVNAIRATADRLGLPILDERIEADTEREARRQVAAAEVAQLLRQLALLDGKKEALQARELSLSDDADALRERAETMNPFLRGRALDARQRLAVVDAQLDAIRTQLAGLESAIAEVVRALEHRRGAR